MMDNLRSVKRALRGLYVLRIKKRKGRKIFQVNVLFGGRSRGPTGVLVRAKICHTLGSGSTGRGRGLCAGGAGTGGAGGAGTDGVGGAGSDGVGGAGSGVTGVRGRGRGGRERLDVTPLVGIGTASTVSCERKDTARTKNEIMSMKKFKKTSLTTIMNLKPFYIRDMRGICWKPRANPSPSRRSHV